MRGRQAIQGAYLIDINAMVFGMPRALFPALAVTVFGGGADDARLPVRRARRGRPGRRAHHRLGQPDPAPGPRGHRRGHRLGRRHHRVRPGALAAPGPGPARGGGLRRRHLGRVPQHDHPARRAGRAAGTAGRACRSPWSPAGRGSGTWKRVSVAAGVRRHRLGGVRRPGLHRGRPGAGPRCCPGSGASGSRGRPEASRTTRGRPGASRTTRPGTAGAGASAGAAGGSGRHPRPAAQEARTPSTMLKG